MAAGGAIASAARRAALGRWRTVGARRPPPRLGARPAPSAAPCSSRPARTAATARLPVASAPIASGTAP